MPSISERSTPDQIRTYERARSVVFLKTHEAFGGLSNMAGGFPLHVKGTRIYTSEALYQACRFPHLPEVQRLIIGQTSPMTAKMKSKPHRKDSRADWDRVRVRVMRWCLRVKLAQNWEKFSELLLRTTDRPIVEESRKDDFWGAKPVDESTLVGMNVLGRLLMELREAVRLQGRQPFMVVPPPDIPDFLLFGRAINAICIDEPAPQSTATPTAPPELDQAVQKQASLFKASVAREDPLTSGGRDVQSNRGPLCNLAPYPTVKNSGVSWLGDVPTHWERRRLKSLLRVIDRRSSTGTETLLSLRRDHGIVVYSEHFSRPAQGASTVGYKIVKKGQLVVNRLQANNGLVFDSSLDGLVSPDYSVFEHKRSDEMVMPYLSMLLRTPTYRNHFRRESTGLGTGSAGFLRLYDDRFLDTPVFLPPAKEQASILRFLHHEDQRIRRYIRAKQKLIKLLDEQKQAIIHRAVTCGMKPHVPFKDSGVPWLPQIPEHWEVLSLRRVITQAVDGPHHSPTYVDTGIPFLSARNIKADRWSLDDAKYISEGDYAEFSKRIVPEVGDVLYTKGGTTGVARAVDLNFRFQVWVHIAVLKVKKHKIIPRYLALVLNSPRCYEQAQLFTRGATNQDLGLGRMKGIVFALPPLSEQEAILSAVDNQTRNLVEAIEQTRRQVDALREFRTRLVSDVVTGNLDVRDAAAGLPEDVAEPAEADEADREADADETSDDLDAAAEARA